MRKKKLYKNKEAFYPITHTEAVLCPDGRTVEQRLQTFQNDVESKLSGGKAANVYPFKDLGTCSNIALANNALDTAFVSEDETLQGHLRLIVNGQIMWIDQIAVNYTKGYWLQVVFGAFTLSQDANTLVSDYSKYHISYRFRNEANTSMAWHDFSTEGLQLKTINGQSLIGTGNIVAGGSGDPTTVDAALDPTSINPIQNKAVYDALFGENGLDGKITTIGNAVSAGKVVMVDSWGTKPSSPTTGIVAYVAGEGIYTYSTGGWGNAVVPDATAIYVNKNTNVVYRWDADNEEMDSLVGQEIDATWVLNSKKPVQSRTIAKRFKKLEIAIFGREQGNSEETLIETDSFAEDLENIKDTIYGEKQEGTRSGGLNTEVTDMKDALYGQGGSALAPASGSISQKISTLETESIKGIKVNGASVEKDQQGIANITVKATSSSYTAQVKSDWTGEDKRASKLTNFEWSEDTDDAILVVDPNTKELWLGYCSDKDSDPRTYIYYQEWIDCGAIPSSDELASKGTTIQYTLGGILHTASYSTSTHKVTEIIIGEGAILKAQIKSDWTGETKSDHKLTNFEWAEDTDDAILVVDTANNELWLGYSDMPDTPRTYTFYQEWVQCGSIPANDTIAEKGQLIQYVSDGITYLATYNPTTHKVVPTGGSSEAIAQIDNSNKAVQSSVLKGKFDEIEGRITSIEGDLGINKSNNSFNFLSDSDEAFSTFDYSKGNSGCFTPKVAPEDITVEDVDNIYTVKPPYEFTGVITDGMEDYLIELSGAKVLVGPATAAEETAWENLFGSLATTGHLWTDYELKSKVESIPTTLKSSVSSGDTEFYSSYSNYSIISYDETNGTSSTTANKNAKALKSICTKIANGTSGYGSCIGFYLKERYYVVPVRAYNDNGVAKESSSPTSAGKPSSYKAVSINLPKDFMMIGVTTIGESNDVTIGGFTAKNCLFYTEYSLYLNGIHFHKNPTDKYMGIYVNTSHYTPDGYQGIGQVQLIDCKFTSTRQTSVVTSAGYYSTGHYLIINTPNTRSFEKYTGSESNIYEGQDYGSPIRQVRTAAQVDHVYIKGCSFEGHHALTGLDIFARKSFRVIGNTFNKFTLTALGFSSTNNSVNDRKGVDKYYASDGVSVSHYFIATNIYMSCPFYVVGNTFTSGDSATGNRVLFKQKEQKNGEYIDVDSYACAVLMEGGCVYMLHNTISDIITGVTGKTTDGGYVKCETYDAYLNCVQVYYANNVVRNITRFCVKHGETVGIFKFKNINATWRIIDLLNNDKSRSYKNCPSLVLPLTMPIIRYVKYNKYTFDRDVVEPLWTAHVDSLTDTSTLEYAHDVTAMNAGTNVLESMYGFRINYGVNTNEVIWDEVAIEYNEIDAGNGNIIGNPPSGSGGGFMQTEKFSLCYNTFKAKNMSSDEFWSTSTGATAESKSEYLFTTQLLKRRSNTSLKIIGNTFSFATGSVTKNVHLFANRYTRSENSSSSGTYEYHVWNPISSNDSSAIKSWDVSKVPSHWSEIQGAWTDIHGNVSMKKTATLLLKTYNSSFAEWVGESVAGLADMQSDVNEMKDSLDVIADLKTKIYGTDISGLSTTKPENPEYGDKYLANEGQTIMTFNTPEFARVSLRFLESFSTPLTVNTSTLTFPFSDEEQNSALETEGTNMQITDRNSAITAIKACLVARGYVEMTTSEDKAKVTNRSEGGIFDVYGNTDKYVRIIPKIQASSVEYLRNATLNASPNLKDIFFHGSASSSSFPIGVGTSAEKSIEGTDGWESSEVVKGLLARIEELEPES